MILAGEIMKQISNFWMGVLVGLLIGVGISAIILRCGGCSCF